MFRRLVSRPLLAAAALVLLALVGAGVWAWHQARSSTPVSEAAAVAEFRRGGGAAGGSEAPGIPRPGVYTYDQSGSERGGAGPVSISRDLPGNARYVVTTVAGGYAEELDISREHIEGLRLRVAADGGSHAVSRRTEVDFLGVGRDDRRDLRPPPVHLPHALPVGRAWSGRYTAGELPVSFHSRVLRREAVEIERRRIPCVVVRTVGDTGGAHPGTRTDTRWWSPALALPLRWTIDMRIRGVVTLDTHADLTLENITPRT
jgi:hypothetical protein